jgi:hypothetical protein
MVAFMAENGAEWPTRHRQRKSSKGDMLQQGVYVDFTALSTGLGAWVLNGKGIWDVERW